MLEFNATFFVAMFSFIIFMIIMNLILYKPLSLIQQERAELIKSEQDAAKMTEDRAETIKQEQQKTLEKSKIIAKDNFNKKLTEYKGKKESIINSAKNMAKNDLDAANAQLEEDKKEAKLLLEPKIIELANLISSKVLGYETNLKGNE